MAKLGGKGSAIIDRFAGTCRRCSLRVNYEVGRLDSVAGGDDRLRVTCVIRVPELPSSTFGAICFS
jgi:hypothetical protein